MAKKKDTTKTKKENFNKKSKKAPTPKQPTYTPGPSWCGTMARARANWSRRNGNGW